MGDENRLALLRAAVGFALVPPTEPELRLLHRWLDSWRGLGDVVTGMNRQGYWLHLSERGRRDVAGDVRARCDGLGGRVRCGRDTVAGRAAGGVGGGGAMTAA